MGEKSTNWKQQKEDVLGLGPQNADDVYSKETCFDVMRQRHKRIDMTSPNALNKGKKQPKKSKKVPATAFRVTFRAFFIEYVSNYCTSSYPSKE